MTLAEHALFCGGGYGGRTFDVCKQGCFPQDAPGGSPAHVRSTTAQYSRRTRAGENLSGPGRAENIPEPFRCGTSFHHSTPFRNSARKPIHTSPEKSNLTGVTGGLGHEISGARAMGHRSGEDLPMERTRGHACCFGISISGPRSSSMSRPKREESSQCGRRRRP